MVSEKRFVVETVEITDCDTDVSRIAKVITDTDETYSYEDLYEVAELLNEQQATIEALLLDRDRQEEKLDIARRNLSKQLEKIEELQKKNAELTERLRECRMRLDKFNCR